MSFAFTLSVVSQVSVSTPLAAVSYSRIGRCYRPSAGLSSVFLILLLTESLFICTCCSSSLLYVWPLVLTSTQSSTPSGNHMGLWRSAVASLSDFHSMMSLTTNPPSQASKVRIPFEIGEAGPTSGHIPTIFHHHGDLHPCHESPVSHPFLMTDLSGCTAITRQAVRKQLTTQNVLFLSLLQHTHILRLLVLCRPRPVAPTYPRAELHPLNYQLPNRILP